MVSLLNLCEGLTVSSVDAVEAGDGGGLATVRPGMGRIEKFIAGRSRSDLYRHNKLIPNQGKLMEKMIETNYSQVNCCLASASVNPQSLVVLNLNE